MDEFPEKVQIARKNWFETDCRGLSASVIKNAYERGFNRAYLADCVKNKRELAWI